MKGKKGLIMGVANERSIAWGISQKLAEAGAELAFTYLGDALKKRVIPLAEKLNSKVTFSCDVEKKEEVVNPHVTELIVTKTMSKRKILMSKMIDGYISLPGGFGTLDELFEGLTLGQLHIEQKPNGLLNINGFFDHTLKQLEVMVSEGYLKQENKEMLLVGNNVSELMLKMDSYIAPEKSAVINKVINHDHKL